MSTRLLKKQEKIEEIIAKLVDTAKGVPVVVEGQKDAEALRKLGVCGHIFMLKTGGKSFADAVDEIEQSGAIEAILLFDFDRRGKQASAHLKVSLEHAHITPNLSFCRELYALLGRQVQCIEGIPCYLETLRQKAAAV